MTRPPVGLRPRPVVTRQPIGHRERRRPLDVSAFVVPKG